MKKLFFILLTGIIALNLTSCLSAGANREEGDLFAVVSYNDKESLPSMLTKIGELAAPDLLSDWNDGYLMKYDCILAHLTLDWDHQPKGASIAYASNLYYVKIDQSPAIVQSDFDETETIDHLLPIQSATPSGWLTIWDGKFFLMFDHKTPQKQDMKYRAIVKGTAANEIVDVFVIAEKLNEPDAPDVILRNYYAFDMHDAIIDLGKTATYTSTESSLTYLVKELKVKVKYCSGLNSNNTPVYQVSTYSYRDNSNAIRTDSIVPLSVFLK